MCFNRRSCASLNEQNYSELLEAFQETHDEANRLVLSKID